MNRRVSPGPRTGEVRIPASKSQAHRMLICAALGRAPVTVLFEGSSNDIDATAACLRALGAELTAAPGGLRVAPVGAAPEGVCRLPCGESGSTLRFLLPVAGALGARAEFCLEGRLPERPLEPLWTLLQENGMQLEKQGRILRCAGRLRAGRYEIAGNVSSQYISGLLLALPLLEADSVLEVTGPVESGAYITMTEQALQCAGVRFEKHGWRYEIPGRQRAALPESNPVEGDWSNAAFFLCMGALSEKGVLVRGLRPDSAQADRAVLEALRRMGAQVSVSQDGAAVRRGALQGVTIDARPIPDLIPVLSVVAALAEGQTQVVNAGRLRLKESDRLASTAGLLRALGAEVEELADGLVITGRPELSGGEADACGDHRIAMSAAVAACASANAVTVLGSECVKKSYPAFWRDFDALKREEGQ